MRTTPAILRIATVLVLSTSLPSAGVSAAPASPAGPPPELTITFVPVDPQVASRADAEALLELGPVAAVRPGVRDRGTAVRQRVGVRIESPAGTVAVARLQAFLATEMPGCTVRIDGVTLTALPRILDSVHRVGTTVVHEVEIVVPRQVPAGPFASAITWVADSL